MAVVSPSIARMLQRMRPTKFRDEWERHKTSPFTLLNADKRDVFSITATDGQDRLIIGMEGSDKQLSIVPTLLPIFTAGLVDHMTRHRLETPVGTRFMVDAKRTPTAYTFLPPE